jgi:hypothetical protein
MSSRNIEPAPIRPSGYREVSAVSKTLNQRSSGCGLSVAPEVRTWPVIG